ncbi:MULTISPECIES: TauD/TfdA family dioxygenase [unclassified Mucilaginibacter]|uniref:TauD/TfdA family dioxygenase n=1 Tax=unclassified Mucilaginibacter TaxID=2617802 RepID=UPI002AC8E603|nr:MULTISPECIES: TauD/TfdA family dioxygenase [unclassified Mucilaginibacter]MEB0260292.1 TauD/TfdA family dioxygenase [Mucilaginibacter sp. 10I4]MEB0277297.1 TauD/TfdA family dioxygenase [Mucilaginibacter sp. 10B2]MEB0302149.1 TauD/TfdA family dioxygenase [Mucilaginibacter sp. 5C4]WPX25424.1 TauD/TfdA family dioxygenase [Mucilaginibacter sp. 5C4]
MTTSKDNEIVSSVMSRWESLPEIQKKNALVDGDELATVINRNLSEKGFWIYSLLKQCEEHSLESLICLCTDISKRLGFVLPQNLNNDLVTLIRDEGKNYSNPATRGHQTNNHLAYHSDRADLSILLYVRPAAKGGALSIVSFKEALAVLKEKEVAAYNILFQEFPFDLREDRLFLLPKWHLRPICWQSEDQIFGHYIRRFINDSSRHEDCHPLTPVQENALDMFDDVLKTLGKNTQFLPSVGEIVITDNFKVLHARTAFDDDQESNARLALRSWVAPYHSMETAAFHAAFNGKWLRGSLSWRFGIQPRAYRKYWTN